MQCYDALRHVYDLGFLMTMYGFVNWIYCFPFFISRWVCSAARAMRVMLRNRKTGIVVIRAYVHRCSEVSSLYSITFSVW